MRKFEIEKIGNIYIYSAYINDALRVALSKEPLTMREVIELMKG